jgi:ribonuclease BN (tRNA processing enzyme)
LKVRVLGAHKMESLHAKHTCFLIDEVLGLDAGSLASSLTTEDQAKVQAVLLTHQHFDHIRDIPTLGLATIGDGNTIGLCGLPETHEALQSHLFNWRLYPDMTESLGHEQPPKFKLNSIAPGDEFAALGYRVIPIEIPHTVPNVGYVVRTDSGRAMAYTGDTGSDISPFFSDELAVDVLFVDASYPNRMEADAKATEHMSPAGLRSHLVKAAKAGLKIPKIVAVHISLEYQEEIAEQMAAVADEMSVDLAPGYEGMELEV